MGLFESAEGFLQSLSRPFSPQFLPQFLPNFFPNFFRSDWIFVGFTPIISQEVTSNGKGGFRKSGHLTRADRIASALVFAIKILFRTHWFDVVAIVG